MPDPFYAGGGIGLGPSDRWAAPPDEPYPAPVVTSRDNVPGPTKVAVTSLATLAERFAWSVRVTYARGHIQHARTGEPGAVPRDSLAVRMARDRQYAVAVYVDHGSAWSWDTLWIAGEHPRRFDQIGTFLPALFGQVHATAPWHPPFRHPCQVA